MHAGIDPIRFLELMHKKLNEPPGMNNSVVPALATEYYVESIDIQQPCQCCQPNSESVPTISIKFASGEVQHIVGGEVQGLPVNEAQSVDPLLAGKTTRLSFIARSHSSC